MGYETPSSFPRSVLGQLYRELGELIGKAPVQRSANIRAAELAMDAACSAYDADSSLKPAVEKAIAAVRMAWLAELSRAQRTAAGGGR